MSKAPRRQKNDSGGGTKRFVALARVSSRPQEEEGFSLESQEQTLRAYAAKEGGVIERLWKVVETGSKAERRKQFNELLSYAKKNSQKLDGLLVVKVDRACRNMADYGRLLELEAIHGIPLIAVAQPTQNTPAGRLARNMFASMGAFFAEQLSEDVKQGLAQRVREGWFPTVAPYGYRTERVDGRSVVRVDPTQAANVQRIFHLYAFEHCTLDMIIQRLNVEGRIYTAKHPAWVRSKIHRILRDRSYIGDMQWHEQWQPGRHEPIIERDIFDRVQALLGEKVYKHNELTFAGERIRCGHCGHPLTGEIVRKKSGKSYVYYRCARYTAPGHPRIRLRELQLDEQILALFDRMQQPEAVRQWFRNTLRAWFSHHHAQARSRAKEVEQQLDEVRRQQERLLNLHLAGTIDEGTFAEKNTELRDRVAMLTLELEKTDRSKDEQADLAVKVFELSQDLRCKWLKADVAEKRRLLDFICLNLVLEGVSLVISTRKPFNCLVEGLSVSDSGEGEIRFPHFPQLP